MEWTIVFKALAPLVGRAAASSASTVLLTWRVAFSAKRRAKKKGIQVKYFALRRFIIGQQIFELFEAPSTERMDVLAPALRNCIKQSIHADLESVEGLLAVLATSYVDSLPPSQATRIEGEATRRHVTDELANTHERNAEAGDFETMSAHLNPFRAEEARRILPQWPALSRAVTAITTAGDRTQLFSDWLIHRPDWLSKAPATVLCWLSSTAQDYGGSHAAHEFLREAISAGATPRSYWLAKATLTSPASHDKAVEQLEQARDHPLGAALWANLHGHNGEAIEQISIWAPEHQEDQATKQLILAHLLSATNDMDNAIDAALRGYHENGSAGCALFAAKLILGRGSLRQHPNFMGDLSRGLELAEAARASRRIWGGDSAEAVLTVISAYKLLGSPEQAWLTGTAVPEGSATIIEANDVRVLTEMAMTAAETGMTLRAKELLPRIPAGIEKDQVQALVSEAESGSAISLWINVLNSTADPSEAVGAGIRLAHEGQAIEWPAWIVKDYASEADDIDLVSALYRDVPGAVPKARARAATSRQVFHGLMSFLASREDYAAAAALAEIGGGRWNDPEAWLSAAQLHLKAGDQPSSIAAAEQAILVGGQAWLRSRSARIILIEVHSDRGQWDRALIEATRLLESEPDGNDVKWAFLTCQFMTSDYEGAWNSFVRLGEPSPRTLGDVNTWLQLHSQFAADLEFLNEAEILSEQWPDNERLRAAIVLSMMQARAKPETDDQVQQYRNLLDGFVADFPESSMIRSVTVDDDNPFEAIKEMLPDPVLRDEALQPIFKGELPVGMATHLSGKSYAEVCLVRVAGKVFAGEPNKLDLDVDAVMNSLEKRVVIDTTALSTLAILGPETAREWLGLFSSVLVPTEAIHDGHAAVRSLSGLSTTSIGIDKDSGGPRIHEISDEEAALLLERARILLGIGRELVSIPHPEITELERLESEKNDFQWLLALDLAKMLGLPFWCDDRALRNLAESVGVQSFGTPALLAAFRKMGSPSLPLVETYEAQLVHNYYTGFRFDPSVMELAGTMDAWRPLGTAAAISDSGPTTSPEQQINFVLKALRHCKDDPEAVQIWVASVSTWLGSVSPDPEVAADNLRVWFSTLLRQEWINSSSLPHVLAGLRSVGSERTDLGVLVPEVLGQLYTDVAEQTNHAVASGYIRELTRLAPTDDRRGVLRRIIAL